MRGRCAPHKYAQGNAKTALILQGTSRLINYKKNAEAGCRGVGMCIKVDTVCKNQDKRFAVLRGGGGR